MYNIIVSEIRETFCTSILPVFRFVAVDHYGNDNDEDNNACYADTDGDCDCSDFSVSCNNHSGSLLQKYIGIKSKFACCNLFRCYIDSKNHRLSNAFL